MATIIPLTRLIEIPNSASIRSAKGFLTRTDWTHGGHTLIRFHDRWCHMQPWLLAALAAWGLDARDKETEIELENANRAGYAWRFGLHDYFGIGAPVEFKPHEPAGRFVPLRAVRTQDEQGQLMADVVPLLHLSGEPEQAKAVQYVLSEMIRNVREHSRAGNGAIVCAQYYSGAASRYVSVGVADTGIGVRTSLSQNYHEATTDAAAVQLAVEPGVSGAVRTGYGSSNNAGAGLFYTRRLAQSSDQYFALCSGNAMFRTSTAKRKPADSNLVFPIQTFPGTVVCANFALENEVDFDDFLKITGEEFSKLDVALREKVRDRVQFR